MYKIRARREIEIKLKNEDLEDFFDMKIQPIWEVAENLMHTAITILHIKILILIL